MKKPITGAGSTQKNANGLYKVYVLDNNKVKTVSNSFNFIYLGIDDI